MKLFIKQFFQDDTGMSSATRLAFILWSIGVFVIWAYMCILTKTLQPIPQTVVELTLVFMAGKIGGAFIENNTPPAAK